MPEHLTVVGPKLSLNVVAAKLSLSQNFARHRKFRVCVRKPDAEAQAEWNAVLGEASTGFKRGE